jgi:hypothetical protein
MYEMQPVHLTCLFDLPYLQIKTSLQFLASFHILHFLQKKYFLNQNFFKQNISINYHYDATVKLDYNKTARDWPFFVYIAGFCYNRVHLCTNMTYLTWKCVCCNRVFVNNWLCYNLISLDIKINLIVCCCRGSRLMWSVWATSKVKTLTGWFLLSMT